MESTESGEAVARVSDHLGPTTTKWREWKRVGGGKVTEIGCRGR